MRNKILMEIEASKVEKLVNKLPLKNKLRILNMLERQTFKERWKEILKDIDKRTKRYPLNTRDILKEIKKYRTKKYGVRLNQRRSPGQPLLRSGTRR